MSDWQRIIKYFAIALAFSLIFSIFSSIYLFGKGLITFFGEDEQDNNYKPTEAEVYESKNEIKNLEIDLAGSRLEIVQGESLQVKSNNKYVRVQEKFSKLSIKEKSHTFSKNSAKSLVTIIVPEAFEFNEVSLDIGGGVVEIDALSTKKLELDLGAGKLTIDNLTVTREADIESGAGEIMIHHSAITDLSLTTGVGKCTLNASLIGNSDIEAGVGELNINLLDSEDNYRIRVEKGIGTIKVDGRETSNNSVLGNGNNRIDVEGGMGSINITFNR